MKILFALTAFAFTTVTLDAQVIRTNPGFYVNSVDRNDDGSSDYISLGFTINFFGKIRDSVYVNNNGNLTFDNALATYTPFGLANTSREIIAPYFADVDTRGAKSKLVTYGTDKVDGHKAFAANYIDVGYYNKHDDKLSSFQVVVIDRSDTGPGNFTIEFNYGSITWETGDASGGVNGYGGVPATVGWSNGTTDPGTSYQLVGSMVSGAFLNSGSHALIRAHLNTSTIGRLIFQARDGVISPGLTLSGGPVLPSGTVGSPYSYAFRATGVDTPVTWDLVPDLDLPNGFRFSNGQIQALPKKTGTYSFTVSATANIEGENVTVYQRGSMTIGVAQLAIKSVCPAPAASVGQFYSANFLSSNPDISAWSVASLATLPPGLVLSPSGVLSGSPSTPGIYSFLLNAGPNDGSGTMPAQKNCTLTVRPSSVQLANGCAMPRGTVGVPYSQSLIPAGGVGPYKFTLLGQLPRGLGLSSDGQITGLPLFSDDEQFDVQIKDSRSSTIQQTCTLGVDSPSMNVTTACPLPRATTGLSYSAALQAAGGSAPYTWSVAGSLPAGLALNASGDRIVGIPMSAGPSTFRLIATDATGQQTGGACSLTVQYGALGVAGCPLPDANVGDNYQVSLRPAGGSQPFVWTPVGTLPPGLQMTSDGVVEGTLTTPGEFQFNVTVRDQTTYSSQPCSLKVKPQLLKLVSPATLAKGSVGQTYKAQFSALGGTPPYRFAFFGYLPDGITGGTDGSLTGLPSKVGTASFGVRVTDASGSTAETTTSLEVGLPPVPTVKISTLPAFVAPASADVVAGVELSNSYTLPVTGQLVMSLSPDTQNVSANANQPDPHVRFANGQLTASFQIPVGGTRVSIPIASTGTVATTMTVAVKGLQAGGVDLPATVTPQVFRVKAVAPILNSACFVRTDYGIQINVLGSSTTRELFQAEVTAADVTRNSDLTGASSDYFSSDGTVLYGGAFNLSFLADSAFTKMSGPFTLRLANTAGWSSAVTAQKCP